MALHSSERLPPKHRLAGVGFSFFTDEEISKLSVTEIVNPIAFDHLNNPTKQGLHDKRLGVSAFDHKSNCPTCGMQVHQCPGHVGHINLTAPLYNPFLVKDVYKLLKAKCFACHRLRIHPSKIQAYIKVLKLLKIGEIVQSQSLKQYMLYAATSIDLIQASTLIDKKKLEKLRSNIVNLAPNPESIKALRC
jgi:DNA-directed RNA polymerase I subunit RPA1